MSDEVEVTLVSLHSRKDYDIVIKYDGGELMLHPRGSLRGLDKSKVPSALPAGVFMQEEGDK